MKTKVTLLTTLVLAMIVIAPLSVTFVKSSWVPQEDINESIAKGLEYLNSTQTRGGVNDGSWEPGYYSGMASTALALLCFENNGHLPDGDSGTDPYVDVVRRGLDYLLSKLIRMNIGVQTHGDPDTNANGYGLYAPGQENYEQGMVIMALVGSGNKNAIATPTWPGRTFIPEVSGRTYGDIVRDLVDFTAWGQCDGGVGRGGWRYDPYNNAAGTSDNSVSPWNILGLHSAELWGISAPAFVKTELRDYWLDYSQHDTLGGFGYDQPSPPYTSDTGGGIIGLDYCGVPASDPRVVNATNWLNANWYETSGWSTHFGNLYAMYNIMKGLRLAIPPIGFVGTHDWYNEYAEVLIGNQSATGYWDSWRYSWASRIVNTEFAILILQYVPVVVKYTLTVKVVDATTNNPISGALVTAAGPTPMSGPTDGGQVVFPEMQAGDYLISASKTGYDSGSTNIFLNDNMEIMIRLTPSSAQPVGGFEVPTGIKEIYAPLIVLGSMISLLAIAWIRRKKEN